MKRVTQPLWYEPDSQNCMALHLLDYFSNTFDVQEVYNIDGRWCIRSIADQLTSFKGLLLPRSVKQARKGLFHLITFQQVLIH